MKNLGCLFPILLFILFLILKLTGVIAWSWLWVTSPLWIGLLLFLLFIAIMFIFFGVIALVLIVAALNQ